MSGISSGIGPFSGINTAQLIEQLLSIEARPKAQVQGRVTQLRSQQAALLDLNSRISGLQTAAAKFRTDFTFRKSSATSSDPEVLTGSASQNAAPGSYQFIVDRLVTTQRMLSRGFADRDATGLGPATITLESTAARLDRDVSLAELNGGAGVQRGKITITDSGGRNATVDLSKTATVREVLDAINGNGTAQVTASVSGGRFVIRDNAGGSITVGDGAGSTTATSLGIRGTGTGSVTGSEVYRLSADTALSQLNDGLGVFIKSTAGTGSSNFSISVNGGAGISVNLGDKYVMENETLKKTENAVTSVGGVLKRINDALTAAGQSTVRAEIASDGRSLRITDSEGTRTIAVTAAQGDTAAADLGLTGSATGTLSGRRVLAALNSTLARGVNGGAGVGGDGALNFTLRDGSTFSLNVDRTGSLSDIMSAIQSASGTTAGGAPKLSVALNRNGTGLTLTDNTGGTASNLIVTGTTGADTAASLGVSTGAAGVASATVSGTNLQRQYITRSTLLSSLNGGKGVGTGEIRFTDSQSRSQTITIDSSTRTLGELIDRINNLGVNEQDLNITARINASGDGIELVEEVPPGGSAGAARIRVEDVSGSVARGLNIRGEASGTGAENKLNGSFERTITLDATDTLQKLTEKINASGAGVNASIITDGGSGNAFRLSLQSASSGVAGRFLIDSTGIDLGISSLETGDDARAFFGSTDPARAVLFSSATNTLDNAVPGVRIDLRRTSATPVTLTVDRDTKAIEDDVGAFVKSYNDLVDRLTRQTRFNSETRERGPLLGDGTVLNFRSQLASTVLGGGVGITGRFTRLTQVGIDIGTGGKLELDADRLRQAIAEDPAAVEELFAARDLAPNNRQRDLGNGVFVTDPEAPDTFTKLGIVGRVEELARQYTNSVNGVFTERNRSLDTVIASQNRRIAAFDERLESRRLILQTQFVNMEKAIANLQRQQASLGQLG